MADQRYREESMGAMAPTPKVSVRPGIVILQATSLCNLNCQYCYVPGRQDTGVMSGQVLEAAARFVLACEIPNNEVEFHWHAGEPLAAGLEFYKRAFAMLAEQTPAGLRIRHAIQTNGTLLTRQWCDLFLQYHVQVGLSVDGPAELHDQNRRTWGGKGTHAKVMEGHELLRRSGITPGAICVLTRESLRWPDRIYDFFKESGFASVAFNVEESEGEYRHSRLRDAEAEEVRVAYEGFMRRIWERWREDGRAVEIREFKQMLGCLHRLRQDEEYVRELDETVPFRILTIRRDGGVSTFSPELASTASGKYGNFVLGNVMSDTPEQVAKSAAFVRLFQDIEAGRERCRENCPYYVVCGAGFQSNRLTEHGSFQATETLTCRLHRMTLADVIIDEMMTESQRNRVAAGTGSQGKASSASLVTMAREM
jgi:uncharacterized protein